MEAFLTRLEDNGDARVDVAYKRPVVKVDPNGSVSLSMTWQRLMR